MGSLGVDRMQGALVSPRRQRARRFGFGMPPHLSQGTFEKHLTASMDAITSDKHAEVGLADEPHLRRIRLILASSSKRAEAHVKGVEDRVAALQDSVDVRFASLEKSVNDIKALLADGGSGSYVNRVVRALDGLIVAIGPTQIDDSELDQATLDLFFPHEADE